ncbi:MAG: TIGR02147 family protein [Fibrobacteria bacterium]|nr:TIGR02147 family protein [Fibrobacteria bacterium]
MLNIFSYTSYSRFLFDYYTEKKRGNPKFSYERLSRKAGFKSRSNLIEISKGKKKLTYTKIFDVARALKLESKESEYFDALVHFNNATKVKEREIHLAKMGAMAGKAPGRILEESKYGYFSEWFHPVIRELVCIPKFDGNITKLAKSLRPPITTKQAKKSLELLLNLKLLVKTPQGGYSQADGSIQTEDELSSYIVLKYQKENLQLAEQALEGTDPSIRDISTLTVGISLSCYHTLKKDIQAFRRHLARVVDKDTGQDIVYQLNLQFFPVSETPKGDK